MKKLVAELRYETKHPVHGAIKNVIQFSTDGKARKWNSVGDAWGKWQKTPFDHQEAFTQHLHRDGFFEVELEDYSHLVNTKYAKKA